MHGDLQEAVYIEPPPGYHVLDDEKWVCKLRKEIYGFKQAPRAWFESLRKTLLYNGYSRSKSDNSLFFKREGVKLILIMVLIYVDDIIVTGNAEDEIDKLKLILGHQFAMKDLGELKCFLGIEVERSSNGMKITQQKYALDLLKRFGLNDCKPAPTPMVLGQQLSQKESHPVKHPEKYRSLVGALQYLTFTRPDITFAVNQVCQFMHDPREFFIQAAKRILRYVKGTLADGLFFPTVKRQPNLVAYSDANWGGDPDSRRSIKGFSVFFAGSLILWSSKKQRTVSRSSAKQKSRAMSDATAERTWYRHLLSELGIKPNGLTLLCDNQSAIKLASNPLFHARSKHIELDCHFVRKKKVEDSLNC